MISVVVDDFDVARALVGPTKAQAELAVDPDAVLPGPVTPQQLQAVARWGGEERQRLGCVQLRELARGDAQDPAKPLRGSGFEERPCLWATKALDQGKPITRGVKDQWRGSRRAGPGRTAVLRSCASTSRAGDQMR